jgi:hypothetical protein
VRGSAEGELFERDFCKDKPVALTRTHLAVVLDRRARAASAAVLALSRQL